MKKVLFAFLVCVFSFNPGICQTSQSIYDVGLTNIDGGSISLNSYQGKKILFIIAPLSSSDSNRLRELKIFHGRYGDSVKIVGIMSIEDGYSSANNAAIKSLYDSSGININIALTSGMYTKKSAGSNQAPLMHWLTEKDVNHKYDTDAKGVWDKYFVNTVGKLYGVSGPGTSLLGASVGWILYRNN